MPNKSHRAGAIILGNLVFVAGCAPAILPAVEVTEVVTETVTVTPEVDWSRYPIIVNGVGVAADPIKLDDASIIPTHLPLRPVVDAFAAELPSTEIVNTLSADGRTGSVQLHGLGGRQIEFGIGDPIYSYGYDEFTDLSEEPGITVPTAALVNGEVYVPLQFFRSVFGADYVAFEDGHIIINTEAPADMN